eukprot:gene12314-15480_t
MSDENAPEQVAKEGEEMLQAEDSGAVEQLDAGPSPGGSGQQGGEGDPMMQNGAGEESYDDTNQQSYAEGDEGTEGEDTGQFSIDQEREEDEDEDAFDEGGEPMTMDSLEEMPIANRLELLSAKSGRSHQSANTRESTPGSAMMDIRGSRPNSAAIAMEIEGFEDDFMERVDEEAEEDYYDEGPMSDEEEDLGPTVEELVERAQYEQQRLVEGNEQLQKKVRIALDFRNKGRPAVNRDLARLDGVSTRYKSALKVWIETLEERDRVEAHYQTSIFDLKSSLEERIKRADDIGKAYKHFRLEVAKSAEHSKTGKPISDRLLAQLDQEDLEKEEEVQRVRLKNIHLSNQMKRIELTLKQKEQLAEGLHLIDFEQLKIENQSLNEKIEERNEELLKLRKKTTTTVQILTHVREKLQFLEKENTSLAVNLSDLNDVLSEQRDKLGKVKAQRDGLRLKGRKIKEGSTFITNVALLNDIDGQKEKRDNTHSVIEDLKQEYSNLSESITKTNQKIVALTDELAAAGAPNPLRSIS